MMKIHRQKRLKLVAPILLAISTLAAATAAERPTQYKLESKILRSEDMLFLEAKNLTAGSLTVGSIGDDEALRKLFVGWNANNKEFDILSAPSISALDGQEAVLCIQPDMQYFERTKDGTFVLKSLPEDESAGVRLTTKTSKVEKKDMTSVDVSVQINTLIDRKKIPDVSLDVGHPVMQTQQMEAKVTIPFGHWMWIGTQQLQDIASGKHEYLLLLFKVTPVDAD